MTRRDLMWRAGGATLTISACGLCLALDGSPATIVVAPLAFLGLPLMIHGRRVGQVLSAERRGHGLTAAAIHAARVRPRPD